LKTIHRINSDVVRLRPVAVDGWKPDG